MYFEINRRFNKNDVYAILEALDHFFILTEIICCYAETFPSY